ncbi:Si-specific NAD(P)(+) transhydrogenase [Mycobacterium avium subsp. paratuberculosis]|nr:Si-specific NAD(P)(+) transhydrogenase [Mycobacterium avium subsp. paratuberculosis]CAG7209070.1 Si-specific NAD(P)(+) transhydrogenase [Mycobacterium avium subsp. paratuberculosis]CAG7210400.1 Si-specific NAD(P)(+) transhydrogenase [Mycobacterium avium subsp. paratuberculosis]
MSSPQEYDMVVIGSGPGGQKAAIASAKLGKSVAVVERGQMLGGVCVNTGTIPSKTLREAVLYLTGMSQRELYGASYRVKEKITPADLLARTQHVIGKEIDVVRNQLMRNRIDLLIGHGRFVDPHTIEVEDPSRREKITISGKYVVIATGTRPARPSGVEFDEDRVLDSDGILDLKSLPTSMVVVGAGVIGIEYASMFAALGTKVTVVEKRDDMLDFCDPEVVEALKFHLRDLAVTFRFGEEVTAVDVGSAGTVTTLASGKQIPAETVMYSAGRQGQTDHLDLHNAELEADNRGRIFVDDNFQTKVPHIYAVGDVIGFPALAATSMEQGRLAAYHAFGEASDGITELQPIGIYSIPEVSYVGATEVELTKDAIPLRGGGGPVPGAGPRPDRRRLLRHAQAAGVHPGPQGARRAHLRHQRHRDGAHRAGRDGLRRHGGIPGRRGVQLPHFFRGLQGGGAGRDEQGARAQPVPPLIC